MNGKSFKEPWSIANLLKKLKTFLNIQTSIDNTQKIYSVCLIMRPSDGIGKFLGKF